LPPAKRITLEQRVAEIAAKRAAGVRVPPSSELANKGNRRSEEKRLLLGKIYRTYQGSLII
jgi:hypothetical protein